jgi:rod shape-determining protein MreC
MPRRPHLIVLVMVVLVVLVLLALPEHTRSRIRVALTSLFLPFFGLSSSVQATAEKAAATATPRSMLTTRIEALETENQQLRLQLAQAEAATRENDRLREMLGYLRRSNWRLEAARVIGRDPANWWRSVHIDVGLRHGISTNFPVLTVDGLVGRIAETGPWSSRVILIGDPNCPVAAALLEGGETGIIRGASSGDLQGTMVDLSFLSRDAMVRPGQRVITSGQGGVFPRGIAIGEVVDSRPVDDGIYLDARVRLAVNLGTLDRVWVKLP